MILSIRRYDKVVFLFTAMLFFWLTNFEVLSQTSNKFRGGSYSGTTYQQLACPSTAFSSDKYKGGSYQGSWFVRINCPPTLFSSDKFKGGSYSGTTYQQLACPSTAFSSNKFKGGSYDGTFYESVGCSPSSLISDRFKGGEYDGFGFAKTTCIEAITSDKYKGGSYDGYAYASIDCTPVVVTSDKFKGGNYDGSFSEVLTCAPILIVSDKFKGGSYDGHGLDSIPAVSGAEIAISGNSINISNGDYTPSLADHTHFDNYSGIPITRTFRIDNFGSVPLNISSVSLQGVEFGEFQITTMPNNVIMPASYSTLEITFTPQTSGLKTAKVIIYNNDCDEGMYTFIISAGGYDFSTVVANQVAPSNTMSIFNTNGTPRCSPFLTSLNDPFSVVVDDYNQKIYWANYTSGTIGIVNTDGSNRNDNFITGINIPTGLAIDFSNQKIYWSAWGSKRIGVANLDGTGVNHNFITTASEPYNLAVDPAGGYIYWTNSNGGNSIGRSLLDGTNVNNSFVILPTSVIDIKIDYVNGRLYLGDYHNHRIGVCNMNGTGLNMNYITGISSVNNIAVDGINNKLYFTSYYAGKIGRCNLDGTGLNIDYITGLSNVAFLHLTGIAVCATPEIHLIGNNTGIGNNDNSPSFDDSTHFGEVQVISGSNTNRFRIINQGIGNLVIPSGGITLSGTHASDFSLSGISLPATVLPGDTLNFYITFAPSASGTRTAFVNIANNDYDENPYTFALQGIGAGVSLPEINVRESTDIPTGSNFSFPNDTLGTTPNILTFTVQNFSTENNLIISGPPYIQLSGMHASDYIVNTSLFVSSVPPLSSTTFSITFSPQAGGMRNASLTIHSNDSDEGTYIIYLNALAIIVGDQNGNGVIDRPTEIAGDLNNNGIIDGSEIAGDINGNGILDENEIAGDLNGNRVIDEPDEIAGDRDGNGNINGTEKAGDKNGNGVIDGTELAGDLNGNCSWDTNEIIGDVNGDGIINQPTEFAGDRNGNGVAESGELVGDINGNGIIDRPAEIAGDANGNRIIDGSELSGDTNGNSIYDPGEKAGDTNGNGIGSYGEIIGDKNGNNIIDRPNEVAGDINGNGTIDRPTEIAGDINGNGILDENEIAGDLNGNRVIDEPDEIAGDVNGNGIIDRPAEIAGDINGNGVIDIPYEKAGDTNGNGIIDGSEKSGDLNGNHVIDNDEIAGDINGNGVLDRPLEIAGDTDGNGEIGSGEVTGDRNGDGIINNGEIFGDADGNGILSPEEYQLLYALKYYMTGTFYIDAENVYRYTIMPPANDLSYTWEFSNNTVFIISETTKRFVNVFTTRDSKDGYIICYLRKQGQPFDTIKMFIRININDPEKSYVPNKTLSPLRPDCADITNNTNDCQESYISTFKMGDINFINNGCIRGGYQDLTASPYTTELKMGQAYKAIIYPNKLFLNVDGRNALLFYAIWIDYNNDGDFEDAYESVKRGDSNEDSIILKNIIIPVVGKNKISCRMRVAMRSTGGFESNEACIVLGSSGEVEDYTVTVAPVSELSAPNYFSPNGDGQNDFFIVQGMDPLGMHKTSVTIFDMQGNEIYSNDDYDNSWDGRDKHGNMVKRGTYYYIIRKQYDREIKSFIDIDY